MMFLKLKNRSAQTGRAQRKAIRKAAALPQEQQSLTAVYALGIRDGLQIAADIRQKTRAAGEDAQ